MKTKKPAAPQSSPLPSPGYVVALVLKALEFRGADLSEFGQPTCEEIAAEIPALRRVNQGPAFDAMKKAIEELAEVLEKAVDFGDEYEWDAIEEVKRLRAVLKLAQEVR